MSSVDRFRPLAQIVPTSDNVRAFTQAVNNKRTERYDLRVRGQVDITVAGTGLANRGSILGAFRDVGYVDGGQDKYAIDARLSRFIAEALAPSSLPSTRLATAGIQAATQLSETVPIWMCAARTQNPGETKYVEANKQLLQQIFATRLALITGVAQGPALAGTVTNMTVDVVQVYDDLIGSVPWLNLYARQIVQDVTAANPQFRIDLRGSRRVRGIAIQQDSDVGEVSDIINSLVLRGDERSIYGDNGIPFGDLAQYQAEEYGGELAPGYLFIDFCRYGRLSTMLNPYEDTNIRLELNVQPSAGVTGSKIRVGILEYESTPATLPEPPVGI